MAYGCEEQHIFPWNVLLGLNISSLQRYSVLSDILVKIELCISLESESKLISFAWILPVSFKLWFSVF